MQMNEWRAQLARLRNLAQRATPGPWADGFDVEETLGRRHDCNQGAVYMNYRDRGPCSRVEVWLDTENARQTEIDAAFIAAANPAMVLRLLDEMERLEKLAELWRRDYHSMAERCQSLQQKADIAKRLAGKLEKLCARALLEKVVRLEYELETAKMMLAHQKKEGLADKLEQTCAIAHSPCDNGDSNADENCKSMTSGLRKATGGESK